MKFLKFAMSSLIGFAALFSTAAFAQVQIDLALPGITGTDSVDGLSGLLPIDSFSFAGKKPETELFVTRPVDASSPALEQAVVSGKSFNSATLYLFEENGLVTTETFSNATAISFQFLQNQGSTPLESVGFAYSNVTIATVPEAATIWLMLLGAGGIALAARRRMALAGQS